MYLASPLAILIGSTVLLAGCAHDINLKNAETYYLAAVRAEQAGNYAGAKEGYRRALINARLGKAPQQGISAATYGYGRMAGYTCDYSEAETALIEALRLEQSLPAPSQANVTSRLTELARLSYDMGKPVEASNYYERAIPLLQSQDITRLDPLGYAIFLEDYARALDDSGQGQKAAGPRREAAALRAANPSAKAKFAPIYYRDVCKK